jgi:hypothetical protein
LSPASEINARSGFNDLKMVVAAVVKATYNPNSSKRYVWTMKFVDKNPHPISAVPRIVTVQGALLWAAHPQQNFRPERRNLLDHRN